MSAVRQCPAPFLTPTRQGRAPVHGQAPLQSLRARNGGSSCTCVDSVQPPGLVRKGLIWFGLSATLVGGCAISPQPEPPPSDPHVAIELLSTEHDPPVLVGAPSAVIPGGSLLQTFNLREMVGPDEQVVVQPDGSFRLPLAGAAGARYRIHVRAGDRYSEPVEITTEEPGPVEIRQPYLGDCFFLTPATTLVFKDQAVGTSTRATIKLDNQCTNDVDVDVFEPRRKSEGINTIQGPVPLNVPSGGVRELEVEFAPVEAGLHEDLVFVMLDSRVVNKRYISVRGRSR